jgi:hypothetical protein
MIGMITLDRRDAERPGHVRPDAGEAELSATWSCRRRGDAGTPLRRAQRHSTGSRTLFPEPLVLCNQTANDRSMRLAAKLGFTKVERFEEYGAEQWFGVWSAGVPSSVSCSESSR